MSEKLINNFNTTLANALNSSGTAVVLVALPSGISAGTWTVIIDSELLTVTAVNAGTKTLTVTRGAEGTAAVAHTAGTVVTCVLSARGLGQYVTDRLQGVPATDVTVVGTLTVGDTVIDTDGVSANNYNLNDGTQNWVITSNDNGGGNADMLFAASGSQTSWSYNFDSGIVATAFSGDGSGLTNLLKVTALAAAPAPSNEGWIYFNTNSKHFFGYNGTTWVQLDN